MKRGAQAGTIYSKVYINGIAVGAEKSTTGATYVLTYTEDITVNYGDLVQIYGKGGTGVPPVCYIRYQRIKFIDYVSNDP